MKLTWHGHACFSLESTDGIIVFDPFEDGSVPGIRNLDLEANEVLCSHEHHDHNARSKVKITNNNHTFKITTFDCFHDDKEGTLRSKNKVFMVETENKKIVHCGDLGHIPSFIDDLKDCDVLLIPVGGHYTIDSPTAKQIIDEIHPKTTIPMHYRSDTFGFDVISHIDDFTKLYHNITYHDTNEIDLNNLTQPIIVLTYK